MKRYKYELKYVVVVDIDASDLDNANLQIQQHIVDNPGPSTPDIELSATEEVP